MHIKFLPSQGNVLQIFCSVTFPGQGTPSPVGVGLLHTLSLIEIPPLHDAVQGLHSVKLDQPPSMTSIRQVVTQFITFFFFTVCVLSILVTRAYG